MVFSNNTQTTQPVDLGAFTVILNQARGTLEIPGLGQDAPIACSVEQFLKAGVFFLSQPIVQQRCPHAAVPLPEVAHPDWLLAFTVRAALDTLSTNYTERFGRADHDGRDALFQTRSGDSTTVTWGDGAMTLEVNRKTGTISLHGLSTISVELLVDIFVTMLRDPYTAQNFSNCAAPYLRRWGENAFTVARLREGIPASLSPDIRIPHTNSLSLPDPTSPSLSEVHTPGPLVMPAPSPSPTPKRGRPVGSSKVKSDLSKREQAVEERESFLNEQEEDLRRREDALAIAQSQLDSDRTRLETRAQEIELEKEVVREEREEAIRLRQEAQDTLRAAEGERVTTVNIRTEISKILQNEINNQGEN